MLNLLVSRSQTDEVEVPTPSPMDVALRELREFLATLVPDALRRDYARLAELRVELSERNEVVGKLQAEQRNGASNARAVAVAKDAAEKVNERINPVRARIRASREALAVDLITAVRGLKLGDEVAKIASEVEAVRGQLVEIERFAQMQGATEFMRHWAYQLPHPQVLFSLARELGAGGKDRS